MELLELALKARKRRKKNEQKLGGKRKLCHPFLNEPSVPERKTII
jgi:hypothetical protein